MSARLATNAILFSALLGGCGSPAKAPEARASNSPAWIASEKIDLRKVTMAVKARPTTTLSELFEGLAERSDAPHASLYRGTAAGGFGSGFALVRRANNGVDPMVITNRHVIASSDVVQIEDDAGKKKGAARVHFEDFVYDLAILKFDNDAPFSSGVSFEPKPAKDRQEVIATGFPGIGSTPSYQTTKGYVSNERFTLSSRSSDALPNIQHTAPIDPGSSGGPLTTENGTLLGVNTFKVFGREGVAFAIPAAAIPEVIARADKAHACHSDIACRKKAIAAACTAAFLRFATQSDSVENAGLYVSARFLAKHGVSSLSWADAHDDEASELAEEDPIAAIRMAAVQRLGAEFRGADATAFCADPLADDWNNLATVDSVRFRLPTGQVASFLWEHGHYKLSDIDFVQTRPKPPSKKKRR